MGHRRHNEMPPLVLPPPAHIQFLNAPLPDGPPLVHYGNDEEEQQPQQPQQPGYMKPTVSSLNKIRQRTKRRGRRGRGGKKKKRKTRRKKRKSRRKTRKKRRRKSRKKRKTRRRKKGGMPGRTLPKKSSTMKMKKSPRVLNLQEMAKKTTDGVWKKFKPKGSTLLKRQPSQGLVEQSLEDELASMTISDSSNTDSNQ